MSKANRFIIRQMGIKNSKKDIPLSEVVTINPWKFWGICIGLIIGFAIMGIIIWRFKHNQ